MKERQLASLFKKSCAKRNLMYVDIPDSMGNLSTPMDGILNFFGKFIAIEHKRATSYAAFHPNKIQENQVRGLDAAVASGGRAIVTLMIWKSRELNLMHFWEWENYKQITNNLTTSLKKDQIQEAPFIHCIKKDYQLSEFIRFCYKITSEDLDL